MDDEQKTEQFSEKQPDAAKKFDWVPVFVISGIVLLIIAVSVFLYFQKKKERLEKQEKAAIKNLKNLNIGCQTFEAQKYGFYGGLATQYFGYPFQSSDMLNAIIGCGDGSSRRFKNLDITMFADDGTNTKSKDYIYRYAATKDHVDEDGFTKYTAYMICAWPVKAGVTGTKIFITNQDMVIYRREASPDITMPLTKWPDEATLQKEWDPVPTDK